MKKVKKEVRDILFSHLETRGDDMILYYRYLESKGETSMDKVFKNPVYRKERGIATYECVSRMRRKIQEESPILLPSKEYIVGRRKAEKNYHDFFQTSLFS